MTAAHVDHVAQPVVDGVARVVLALMLDQRASGWSVRLVCPDGWLADQARAHELPRVAWSATRQPGPAVPGETARLARLLGSHDGIVHLHSSKAGLAGRLALRGRRPTVFQPHAWSFNAADRLQGRAAVQWERLAVRWTSLRLSCSPEEEQEAERARIGGRSAVVPNGVDVERFAVADAQARAASRARLGLPDDIPVAVCVGRLSPQKGQDVAIRAWPAVRASAPGARLLLVGEGPDAEALRAIAGEGVELLGVRSDVPDLLAAADLALLPSRWEGLALALLEAMASGRPVVTTDVAGSRSTVEGGSLPAAGAVVPVGDADALAAAVVKRLTDPARAHGEGSAGRRRVEQSYDLRTTTRQVRDAYQLLQG